MYIFFLSQNDLQHVGEYHCKKELLKALQIDSYLKPSKLILKNKKNMKNVKFPPCKGCIITENHQLLCLFTNIKSTDAISILFFLTKSLSCVILTVYSSNNY